MAEFKLKRGRKVYHIRAFSSLVELTRRGLVAPDDPIYVPSVKRWVFARAIHELAPLLQGRPSKRERGHEDAEWLPTEFVEPLEEFDHVSLEVDEGAFGLIGDPGGVSGDLAMPAAARDGPDRGADLGASPDVRPDAPADERLTDQAGTSAHSVSETAPWHEPPDDVAGRDLHGSSRFEPAPRTDTPPLRSDETPADRGDVRRGARPASVQDRSWHDPEAGGSQAAMRNGTTRGATRAGGASPPMSFQDWMAEKAREDALDLEDAALLPLLVEPSPVREVSAAPQVRWGRLLVLVGVLVTLFGAYFLYVKVIAEQAYEPWTPPRAATPVPGSPRQAHPVEPLVTPEPGASATDFRLRRMVSPNVVAFRSFEQAEDRLFGELLNLKIGVTNVQLIPVDSDTIRSVRRTLSDVSVRLRGSDLSAEEQTAIVGLVVGKYMSRERLNVRDLIMRLERGGQVPIVRIVPGKSAEAYFSGRINYPQYLLAVQAGTVSPSP